MSRPKHWDEARTPPPCPRLEGSASSAVACPPASGAPQKPRAWDRVTSSGLAKVIRRGDRPALVGDSNLLEIPRGAPLAVVEPHQLQVPVDGLRRDRHPLHLDGLGLERDLGRDRTALFEVHPERVGGWIPQALHCHHVDPGPGRGQIHPPVPVGKHGLHHPSVGAQELDLCVADGTVVGGVHHLRLNRLGARILHRTAPEGRGQQQEAHAPKTDSQLIRSDRGRRRHTPNIAHGGPESQHHTTQEPTHPCGIARSHHK